MSISIMGWLSRSEQIALGWTLLHFCWQGTVVAVLYALVDRVTARAASGVRYAVALAALALMPLMVALTFAAEMQTTPTAQVQTIATRFYGIEPQAADSSQVPLQQVPLMTPSQAKPFAASLALRAEALMPWVDGLWLFGVLLLAARALGGWLQLDQLRRRARGIVPAHLEQSFKRVCERINVGRSVALRVSDEVISPLAMGIWRATIILPVSSLLRLSTEELEAVLAHELGHIRRWDYVCNLLQVAVESLLFFHPAVWWVSKAVRDRREFCCDEIAVRNCADAVVYAQALLHLEEQKTAAFELAVALKGHKGSLLGRVEKVLGDERPMVNGMTSGVRVMVAGAVVAGLLLGPRVSDAVAASQPIMNHVAALLPAATLAAIQEKPAKPEPGPAGKPRAATIAATSAPAEALQASSNVSTSVQVSLNLDTPVATLPMMAQADVKASAKGSSYIDGMRDAGYPLDLNNNLDELVSLKSLGVTPEYAKEMAGLGLGKPSVHELISLKSLGVTPEYAKQVAALGLGQPTLQDLVSLKALGVTPEYLAGLKQSGISPKDFHEVMSEKSLGITPEYAEAMKKAGFGEMTVQDLISNKAQGVTPEYAIWLRKEFPNVSMDELRKAAVFHIDEKFIVAAKAHGIDGTNFDKLVRLKISGLLDE